GTTSLSTMHKQLVTLENKGFIKRHPNMKRAIELSKEEDMSEQDRIEIPCMGLISEGNPIETPGSIEYMKLPDKMTKGRRVFMLKAKGKAYEGEKIINGDYLIIESTTTFKNFNLVLISNDPQNTTLRRITKEKGKINLYLANPAVKKEVLDESEVKIMGVVIGVFRSLVE
ncbi:transcriptional repressor LexA, partial [bacterium]|nr:transcriptional repressor LexA [bacterium]